jgi:hypothetical protein
MNPIELFKHRILVKNPDEQIEKQCQVAKKIQKHYWLNLF